MVRRTTKQSWHGFVSGQRVRMLIETRGATADDEEITYPSGTLATISTLADFGVFQGEGVDLVIGDGDSAICNSFDDRDVEVLGGIPFMLV
jgi:hypothetical protein